MEKYTKKLVYTFLILCALKFIISLFINNITVLGDEYVYFQAAKSLWTEQLYGLHGQTSMQYPPLYSLILAPIFVIKNTLLNHQLIQTLNILISTSILFITFYFAKAIGTTEKKAYFISLLVALFPSNFILFPYIMSENLYYPLFLLTVYAFYMNLKKDSLLLQVGTGILIGLCFLTRILAAGLILAFLAFTIYKYLKTKSKPLLKKKIITFITAGTIASFWPLRQFLTKGTAIQGYENTAQFSLLDPHILLSLLAWIILYSAALTIITYIAPIQNFFEKKKDDLKLLTYFILGTGIIIAAYHAANYTIGEGIIKGRPILRYINFLIPLILIQTTNKIKKESYLKYLILLLPVLSFYPLLPYNNPNFTILGLISLITKNISLPLSILVMLAVSVTIIKFYKKINFKTLLTIVSITSILALGATAYNSQVLWQDNIQLQISEEIKHLPQNLVVLDKNSEGTIYKNTKELYEQINEHFITLIDFKTNKQAIIEDSKNFKKYQDAILITTQELPFNKITTIKDYHIYENNN